MTPGPEMQTATDLLAWTAASHRDRPVFIDGDRRLTFGELAVQVESVAASFSLRGLGRGDVVLLRMNSSVEFAITYLAAMTLGAVTSAVNPRLGSREMEEIRQRAVPDMVVSDEAMGDEVGIDDVRDASRRRRRCRAVASSMDDPVAIVWTSGTSGSPKGAVYTHRTLRTAAGAVGDISEPFDVRLSSVPFAHVGFMGRVWDTMANAICEVIVPSPWRAEDAVRLIEDECITVAQGVPTQWELMLGRGDLGGMDTSGLRVAAVGGAPSGPGLVRRMREQLGCPVLVGYATTETGTICRTRATDPPEIAEISVGRPTRGVDVVLVDEAEREVDVGEVGRVRVTTSARMAGYWDRRGAPLIGPPEGPVFTGDLGRWLPTGDLQIVGRQRDLYIRGGYNIYPSQVEIAIQEHPDVDAAAVLGAPDPVLGEVGVGFVVTSAGGSAMTSESLRRWLKGRLADYKVPDAIEFVPELPLNSVGKVDKRKLGPRASELAEMRSRSLG